MICYMGRSYCNRVCETLQCDRNFTPAVKAAADKWWETWNLPDRGAPVSFSPTFAKTCGEYRPPVATHSAKALDSIPTHGKLSL
jgi:hypothetical protein